MADNQISLPPDYYTKELAKMKGFWPNWPEAAYQFIHHNAPNPSNPPGWRDDFYYFQGTDGQVRRMPPPGSPFPEAWRGLLPTQGQTGIGPVADFRDDLEEDHAAALKGFEAALSFLRQPNDRARIPVRASNPPPLFASLEPPLSAIAIQEIFPNLVGG